MTALLANHLWQSMLFAAVVALGAPLTLGALSPPRSQTTRTEARAVPAFEVATVRINTSRDPRAALSAPPGTGRLTITNMPLRQVILSAYSIQPFQLVNAPEWLTTERVDIVAKAESPVPVSALQQMLQPLHAERFKLVVHREMHEMDALALVLVNRDGRLGPNLQKSEADCAGVGTNRFAFTPEQPVGAPPPCGITPAGLGRIVATGIDMLGLAALLAPSQRRAVVDRTGLVGRYDVNVTYTPEAFSAAALAQRPGAPRQPDVDPDGPPLVTALPQQLGLKLESIRASVEVVVVDHIEALIEG